MAPSQIDADHSSPPSSERSSRPPAWVVPVASVLQSLRSHHLAKGVVLVLGSRMTNSLISFVLAVSISRILGPESFGLYTFFMMVLIVGMELAGSEGLNLGLVHFVAKNLEHDSEKAATFVRIGLLAKLVAVLGLALVAIISVPILFPMITDRSNLLEPLCFGIVGACLASLWRGTLGVQQAQHKFKAFAALGVVPNVVKALLILVLISAGQLTLSLTLAVSVLGFLLGLLAGSCLLPRGVFRSGADTAQALSALLAYSKWTIAHTLLRSIYHRSDILILGVLASPAILGGYAVAVTLASVIYLFYEAALAVLLPNVTRLRDIEAFRRFIPSSIKVTATLSLVVVVVFGAADPLVSSLFSDAYTEAAPILRILCVGLAFTIVLDPLAAIVLARGRPQKVAAITVISLFTFLGAAVLLYPVLEAKGIAWATVIARAVNGIIVMIAVWLDLTDNKRTTGLK